MARGRYNMFGTSRKFYTRNIGQHLIANTKFSSYSSSVNYRPEVEQLVEVRWEAPDCPRQFNRCSRLLWVLYESLIWFVQSEHFSATSKETLSILGDKLLSIMSIMMTHWPFLRPEVIDVLTSLRCKKHKKFRNFYLHIVAFSSHKIDNFPQTIWANEGKLERIKFREKKLGNDQKWPREKVGEENKKKLAPVTGQWGRGVILANSEADAQVKDF